MIKTLDVPNYEHGSILRPTGITTESALTGYISFRTQIALCKLMNIVRPQPRTFQDWKKLKQIKLK